MCFRVVVGRGGGRNTLKLRSRSNLFSYIGRMRKTSCVRTAGGDSCRNGPKMV